MVSLSQRDEVAQRIKADAEMRGVYALVFAEDFDYSQSSAFAHSELLKSVALKDCAAFQEQVNDIGRRGASEDAVWYNNDSLIFLLLLGCASMSIDMHFLDGVLAARDRNTNSTPRRINEIFHALRHCEYGLEGRFSFIKITFLNLLGKLKLTVQDAEHSYKELTSDGFLEELSPFHQLLALRAFDLILFRRVPNSYESVEQLVVGIEELKNKVKLGDVFKMMKAFPVKWVWGGISIIAFLVVSAFGVGMRFSRSTQGTESALIRPSAIKISQLIDPLKYSAPAIQAIAKYESINHPPSQGESNLIIGLETSKLISPTPKFSVELTTSDFELADAEALLVQSADGGMMQTLLPSQTGNKSARIFLPPLTTDSNLIVILIIHSKEVYTSEYIASRIVLRILD